MPDNRTAGDARTENRGDNRIAIIAACREMNRIGINHGSAGNISMRDGAGMLITPTSLAYDVMRPEDLVWMGFDGTEKGRRQPSSEWRFHLDIYRARPEVSAVVHAHPIACATLSIMGKDIPPLHYMIAVAGGHDIRCAPYATFGTEALSRHALAALDGRMACLLGHHGMIAVGATLDKAMWLAAEVEALARMYLGCLPMGEPPLLSVAEIENVIRHMAGYGHAD